jgi:manganese/zinc/iron transport system ATP- binding protein
MNMSLKSTLKVENMTVHYDGAPALWDISLEIPKGRFVGILGPNGAGKSTFIKALLGLTERVSGSISFGSKKLDQIRGEIAYIPQKELVDFTFPMTVFELVLMGCYPKLGLFGRVRKEDRGRAEEALLQVGMQEFRNRQIGELSGGQQQRIFLARAIVQDAEYYFLDEALSGVDHVSEEIIMAVLKEMQQAGKTILMVHHDLNTVERYFDWLIFLNIRLIQAGAIVQVFTPQVLEEAFGKNIQSGFQIYAEALKLQQEKRR